MKGSKGKIKHLQRNCSIIQGSSQRKSMMRSFICTVCTEISWQRWGTIQLWEVKGSWVNFYHLLISIKQFNNKIITSMSFFKISKMIKTSVFLRWMYSNLFRLKKNLNLNNDVRSVFYKFFNLHYGTLYYKVNLICLYVNKFNFQNYYFYICEYLKHLIYIKNLNYFCLFSSSFYVL